MDNYETYEVNEVDFTEACNRASYWAKCRTLKKMQKVVHRPREWKGEFKEVNSPLSVDANGKPTIIRMLDVGKPFGVFSGSRPPKDVEEAVKRFVWLNKDKAKS